MITGYSNTVSVTTLQTPFQFTVDTSQAGVSGPTEFTMPLTTSTGLDMYVDWGDGSAVENITDHTLATHDYGTAGTYTISVTGDILGWSFLRAPGFPGDNQKILDIKQWSGFEVTNDGNFYGCTNLTASATDAPQISTSNLLAFFRECTNFNGAIGNWDMSGVTSLRLFLRDADAFDQDISNWDINQVTNFDDFMTAATGLSTTNYDLLLVAWEAQAPTYSGAINFGGSQYSAAGYAARQSLIDNYGWTITDGGLDADADAQAFFNRVTTAGGSLSTTEQNAINTLVIQMKADGIWTKMKAIYPMVGASAAACAQNLKSSSFTGTFNGGWTFASTGATPNGTNGSMDTGLDLNIMNSINDISYGYYNRTNNLSTGSFGWGVGGFIYNEFWIKYTSPSQQYGYLFDTANDGRAVSDCRGFNAMSRIATTTKYIQLNSTIDTYSSASSGSLVSRNFYFASGSQGYEARENAFGFVGDGLTSTNLSDFYTAVQAFQTTLSRNV